MNAPSKIDFYGRLFAINQHVLIPRPETEQLIDSVLNLAGIPYLPGVKPSKRQLPNNPTILDIGTGSGCIAITLKKEIPEATIYASDISKLALEVAQKNATRHKASISFIESDLLNSISFTPDVIVANLPYVDPNWDWLDKKALSREPSLALYAEEHGLALIKQLIDQTSKLITEYLILEADPSQHQEIIKYAQKAGFKHVETRGYILTFCRHQASR